MSTESAPHPSPSSPRPSAAGRAALVAAVPGAVLSGAWITAGRALFGAGGTLVPVFAVTVLPVYLVVLLLAWHRMRRAARRSAAAGQAPATTAAMAGMQALTWVLALGFGFLVPDRVDGRSTSALAETAGDQTLGLSAGFGNTVGILTFVAAFWLLILAVGEDRRTARRAAGGPVTEDEWLDAQGYEGGSGYEGGGYEGGGLEPGRSVQAAETDPNPRHPEREA